MNRSEAKLPNIQAVSKDRHENLFWKPVHSYSFTANDVLCPLVAHEIPEACLSLPIAFSKSEDKFLPVAILGLAHDQNLVVDPSGNWRGPYVPRVYRCFPFSLALSDEERVLCVDEDIALTDDSQAVEPFFQGDGQPSKTLVRIMEFLNNNLENATQTELICNSLTAMDLIEPWPLKAVIDSETHSINGLYRIRESALDDLSVENLSILRDNRALLIVYSQLLSMAHMKNLVKLAQSTVPTAMPDLDFDSLDDGGTLSFSNL
jgi:hypothetical protein